VRRVAVGLTCAALCWSLIIIAVPMVAGSGATVPRPVVAVYAAGALLCHQRPDRSFRVRGVQMPVCARCTALYFSGAIGALAGWLGRPREPRRLRMLLAVGTLPLALSVALGWAGLVTGSNLMRAASALPAGGLAGWVIVRMLRSEAQGMRYDLVV
jgi:uncharacterized membrane protein